jgi:hypothetical protein
MQLTNTSAGQPAAPGLAASLRGALAAATAALLAPAAVHAQASTPAPAPATAVWQIDSAVLIYQESDGRVGAIEPVISARRSDGNDRSYGLRLTLDALTGASPNGATAQPVPQTFTSPSGNSQYVAPAGRPALDPTFKDQRVALAGSFETPIGNGQRLTLGANVSSEYDFTSASLSAGYALDMNNKNTTLSLGLALEGNQLRPVGGMPLGLRPAQGSLPVQYGGSTTRNVADVLLGVTQVVNRQWLMQTNLSWGRATGNLNDPYKILSVLDGSSGLITGDRYVSELRPDSRSRVSLFWQNKVHLTQDVVDASYRFYRDDWGVQAHTLDLRYRYELPRAMYLEPHWRMHRQSAADFSRGWLIEGQGWSSSTHQAGVSYASADPRLAAFTAQTLGAKFGMPLGKRGEFTARVELYRQTPQALSGAPGVLQTLELTPVLKATTLVLGYSTPF